MLYTNPASTVNTPKIPISQYLILATKNPIHPIPQPNKNRDSKSFGHQHNSNNYKSAHTRPSTVNTPNRNPIGQSRTGDIDNLKNTQ